MTVLEFSRRSLLTHATDVALVGVAMMALPRSVQVQRHRAALKWEPEYDRLRGEVATQSRWDEKLNEKLYALQMNSISFGADNTIQGYTLILRLYYYLKTAKLTLNSCDQVIRELYTDQYLSLPKVGMAVRWILSRVYLSKATANSISKHFSMQYTMIGLKLFLDISDADLDFPVLLPGLLQEYGERLLVHSKTGDPETRKICKPNRYIGSAAIALAAFSDANGSFLLESAAHFASRVATSQPDGSLPILNALLVKAEAKSLMRHDAISRKDTLRLLETTHNAIVDIQTVSDRKRLEWLASCCTNTALITDSRKDRQNAIDSFEIHLRTLMTNHSRTHVPDYLFIDPCYRKLVEGTMGQESLSEYVRTLMPNARV